jgi:predicted nucleic acid-binding protein
VAEIEDWPVAICDAGPLIHLDEIVCLDLLSDFQDVLIPEQVREEVTRHRPGAVGSGALSYRCIPVAISAGSQFRALVKAFSLGTGEQAALSLMSRSPGAILLTDDAAARLAAKALGFRVHGSLGVLLRSIRTGRRKRAEVLSLLREIPTRSTLHIRANLLQEITEQVESWPEDVRSPLREGL